jgi:hypothetical protein
MASLRDHHEIGDLALRQRVEQFVRDNHLVGPFRLLVRSAPARAQGDRATNGRPDSRVDGDLSKLPGR